MSTTDFAQAHFCGCTPWQEEAALTEETLWELLSVSPVHGDHTYPEPGKDLIPWGHDSSSAPWLTRTRVGSEDKADLAGVHVAPPGSSGWFLWNVMYIAQLSISDLPRMYNCTAALPCLSLSLWFAPWPHESSLAVPMVLYRVRKVLHPNNVN